MNEEIILNKGRMRKIYDNSSREEKKFLEKIFGTELFNFDYREIKSFEDACMHLGISTHVPIETELSFVDEQVAKQCEAVYKLMVISKALCNGKYTDSKGIIWCPFYILYTKEEVEGMREEKRKEKGILLLTSCQLNATEGMGIRYNGAYKRNGHSFANYGFPLYANSKEMAEYLDEQFRDLIFQCYGIEIKKDN